MEAGVCGLPGRSAAGHVEVASPLLSDTATAPGTDLAHLLLANASSMFLLLNFTKAAQCESEDEPYLSYLLILRVASRFILSNKPCSFSLAAPHKRKACIAGGWSFCGCS